MPTVDQQLHTLIEHARLDAQAHHIDSSAQIQQCTALLIARLDQITHQYDARKEHIRHCIARLNQVMRW